MNTTDRLPETGYVTAQAVKQRYAISNSTLYKWITDQRLPAPVKIGARGALPRRGSACLRGGAYGSCGGGRVGNRPERVRAWRAIPTPRRRSRGLG